jgi:ABC-type sugar transport system ATPase subunit
MAAAPAIDPPPAVAVTGLTKAFPGVQALRGVDLSLAAGEVRALLGKNGAGKSTLVKILSGAQQPDAGRVELAGAPVVLPSPAAARDLGIATVHQELSLVPELSVAENVLLGRWRRATPRSVLLAPRALREAARAVLDELEVDLDPATPVGRLGIAQQQTVEIARALSYRPRLLVLDEPTSSLPADEVDVLLRLVRRLAASGVAVVYVSHRMDEIPRVADSVTVLRDGRHLATRPIAEADTRTIVDLMTGGAVHEHRPATGTAPDGPPVLSVRDLHRGDRVRGVSLDLRAGEVVGLAGLLGSGRTELLRCLYGLDRADAGEITVDGRAYTPSGPIRALRRGIGFTPEDRKADGLALGMSVSANLVMTCLDRIRHLGLLSRGRERSIAADSCADLRIKAPALGTPAGALSGGNQQKIVLGKFLNAGVRVLLLDEPTRGVDVEAKDQIYALVRRLAAEGAAVLVASSELEELFLFCDRLLVLRAGRVVAEHRPADTTPADVMALAMGGTPS